MASILFVGDTLPEVADGHSPYTQVEQIWNRHDLVVVNLETTIMQEPKSARTKSVVYAHKPESLRWLQPFGDRLVVSLANNHMLDCGIEGYKETLSHLDEAGIRYIPLDAPLALNVNGRDVVLHSLHAGISNDYQARMLGLRGEPATALPDGEKHIAFMHWGEEHVLLSPHRHVEIVDRLRAMGFCSVVGNGPHTAQGVYPRDDVVVCESLGNFDLVQIDIPHGFKNSLGFMLSLELSDAGVSWKRFPYFQASSGRPFPVDMPCVDEYFARLDRIQQNYDGLPFKKRYLTYRRHSSRTILFNNIRGGWIPRIRKGGFSEVWKMIRWLTDPHVAVRYPFIFWRRDKAWKLIRRLETECISRLQSLCSE